MTATFQRTRPVPMTGPELRTWREHWLLSRSQLAHWLGIHINTVIRWEAGDRDIPLYLRPALETFERDLAADLLERARGPRTATATP